MDQLDSKAQDVLYTIFEWPYLPKSRLSLIGEIVPAANLLFIPFIYTEEAEVIISHKAIGLIEIMLLNT